MQTLIQGEPIVTRMPALTSAVLARIDCKTTLAALLEASADDVGDAWAQWRQLYAQLNAVGGWLFMTDMYA